MPSIPKLIIDEFMKNDRLVAKHRPDGTRPVDLKVFQQVLRETLAKKEVMQGLVNAALKQGQFQMR